MSRKSGRSLARRARLAASRSRPKRSRSWICGPKASSVEAARFWDLVAGVRRAPRDAQPVRVAGPLSPAVGGNAQAQRRNPFASSAPLASTGASAGSGRARTGRGSPEHGPAPDVLRGRIRVPRAGPRRRARRRDVPHPARDDPTGAPRRVPIRRTKAARARSRAPLSPRGRRSPSTAARFQASGAHTVRRLSLGAPTPFS